MAMELIETIEVGAATSAIEFTGIPDTGQDILILTSFRSDSGNSLSYVSFNGVYANLSHTYLYGNTSSVSSSSDASNIYGAANNWSSSAPNAFASSNIYISNYASSSPKSYDMRGVTPNSGTPNRLWLVGGRWNDTSPITAVKFTLPSDNFVQYSTASLYLIS